MLARNKRNFNEVTFKDEIRRIDWSDIFEQSDVNLAYGIFEDKYLEILNRMAPIEKIQIRKQDHTLGDR